MSTERRALVPKPLRTTWLDGRGAELADGMRITAPGDGFDSVARWFRRELEAATGWRIDRGEHGTIELRQGELQGAARPSALGGADERYRLRVAEGRAVVTAPSAAGAFYGLQTLRQLLPDDCYRRSPVRSTATAVLDAVEIEDAPRFGWRGLHLDVSRHFLPKEFVLRLVDLAALHKLNVLHLHLTDDQGWRVPIPKYPRLVEVGAWRRESPAGHWSEPRRGDGIPHGGWYTRADLAEIVSYAAERHLVVLPEIDMPGHMLAAIAAYPELSNTAEPLEVGTSWGISSHVLNLEEPTIRFCRDVLDEVADIFPGTHLHVGGDECPTTEWESSPYARALMGQHQMSAPGQLQGWFTARIAEHVRSLGRRLVGWDEILEGGAPEGAVVMSWRGEEGGVAAAAAGHDVVMAPEQWLYFDWAYSDDPAEPVAIRPATSVERVFGYDPLGSVAETQRHRVLGAQCQLWTEYVATPSHAEYLYFPRLCALSEVAWSDADRDFGEFEARLGRHLGRLEALGVNYRPLAGPTPGQARTWTG